MHNLTSNTQKWNPLVSFDNRVHSWSWLLSQYSGNDSIYMGGVTGVMPWCTMIHLHVLNVLGMQMRSPLHMQTCKVAMCHHIVYGTWLLCKFAYVNEISFAYPEHLVHTGVALSGYDRRQDQNCVLEVHLIYICWTFWFFPQVSPCLVLTVISGRWHSVIPEYELHSLKYDNIHM